MNSAHHILRSRLAGRLLAGALLAAGVAGCAASNAAPPPKVAARSQATPVPTVLVAYGSAALNTVNVTLVEGQQLASQMKHDSFEDVSNACSDAGGIVSGQYDAFQSVYLPPTAHAIVYGDARVGYRTVLSAIDECGMAADGSSRSQLKVALHDLASGLWYLGRVESHLKTWSVAH
jgi:hypothetical protein